MHHYNGPGRSVAFAAGAMCATSHPLAALTALDMLKQGGNAVDAAVAGAVVPGFCEPAKVTPAGARLAGPHPAGRRRR